MKKIFYAFIVLSLVWSCTDDEDYSQYLPKVTTAKVTDITDNTALSGGEVLLMGYSEITEKGVCWSTKENPTIDDNLTKEGKGIGKFESEIAGLKEQTVYYVRAYAINSKGIAYGNQVSFSTEKKKNLLEISENTLTIVEEETGVVTITSGNDKYEVKSSDENIATVELKGAEVIISGKSSGNVTITITDTEVNQNKEVAVTIKSPGNATITDVESYISTTIINGTSFDGKIVNQNDRQLKIKIPYTNGEGKFKELEVKTQAVTGRGGDTNMLTLHIPETALSAQGELVGTISVDGDGEYNLDEIAPGKIKDIAEFTINKSGINFKVVLKGIGGIPDRLFGVKTNNELEHQFIYLPVVAADGRVWLNNNLGANYSNMNSSNFNPEQQAYYNSDHNAYGSIFQWQRPADGHELITWDDDYGGTAKHDLGWYDELHNYGSKELWKKGGANNPCPYGFRLPTKEEVDALLAALGTDPDRIYYEDKLKLTLAGHRNYQGGFRETGDLGIYWTSDEYPDSQNKGHMAWELNFDDIHTDVYGTGKANGQCIRCIQDK